MYMYAYIYMCLFLFTLFLTLFLKQIYKPRLAQCKDDDLKGPIDL